MASKRTTVEIRIVRIRHYFPGWSARLRLSLIENRIDRGAFITAVFDNVDPAQVKLRDRGLRCLIFLLRRRFQDTRAQ